MPPDDDFQEVFFPVLDRLVAAGLLVSWSYAGEKLEMRWCEDFLGRGPGDRWFRSFATVLSALCPEEGLTELEQATLLNLAGILKDQG